MDDHIEKAKPLSRKRSRKPKSLDFVGWGSKNLIDFLESLGRDTTNKISEYDVTYIVRNYIRELHVPSKTTNKKKKTKMVTCDEKLSLLFGCEKINLTKLPDLVSKHYVENQEDEEEYGYLYSSEEEDDDKKERLALLDKVVEKKRRGSVAAIVRDNVKLLYLRKSLVMELAKTSETFVGKVLGTFVRIKNPCQLVHVTGVKEGNPIDGYFLQVTNYCYYLKDVASSSLSDDDFTQEECEELQQRIKNSSVKRLTVVEMEEKVRSLHEDVTKHWIARELVLLPRKINQASEKGWKRELSQYLDRRELLSNPEEQSRLLLEVPEVIAEEVVPESVDVDVNIEDEFIEPNPEAHQKEEEEQQVKASPVFRHRKALETPKPIDEDEIMEPNPEAHQKEEEQQLKASPVFRLVKALETPKLLDEEDQPSWSASAAGEQPEEDGIITQSNKDSIFDQPQAQPKAVEIIELSDDDEEEEDNDNDEEAYEKYDPKKKMWCYEMPKGHTHGPFSLADLKEWSDQEYFLEFPDFKVFKTGNTIESGVVLTKLLAHVKG